MSISKLARRILERVKKYKKDGVYPVERKSKFMPVNKTKVRKTKRPNKKKPSPTRKTRDNKLTIRTEVATSEHALPLNTPMTTFEFPNYDPSKVTAKEI